MKRIRKALEDPSPATRHRDPEPLPELGQVMPPVPRTALVDKFEAELQAVTGTVHRAASTEELDRILQAILGSCEPGPVMLSRNPVLAMLRVADRIKALGRSVITWPDAGEISGEDLARLRAEGFGAAAGITGVDFVLAESGTLVVSSVTEGGQMTSLAPPVHVALYRRAQVVESLEAVLAGLPFSRESNVPISGRSVVFITGTSRTADIEQITIRGVHGPTHVHAVLVEDTIY